MNRAKAVRCCITRVDTPSWPDWSGRPVICSQNAGRETAVGQPLGDPVAVAAVSNFDKNLDLGKPDGHVAVPAFVLDLDDVSAKFRN